MPKKITAKKKIDINRIVALVRDIKEHPERPQALHCR